MIYIIAGNRCLPPPQNYRILQEERSGVNERTSSILVSSMEPADVTLAFPLVAIDEPGLTLAVWRRRARRLTSPDSRGKNGVFLARYSGMQGPCGAAFYHVVPQGKGQEAICHIKRVVVLTMGPSHPITIALIQATEEMARRLGCQETHIHLVRPDPYTLSGLCSSGYASEAILLHKSITSPELVVH